jgi:phage tail sheath gpL-like
MASIPILGVPSTYRVPGGFAEIKFAQGPSSAAAPAREVILVMPKLAASGTWTAGAVYEVKSEQDLIDGAGAGSPIHRAGRIFLQANKTGKLWALPHLPSSGAGVATALLTVTYTNDPTVTGVTTITVAGEDNSVAFTSSDTVTTIADAMVLVINSKAHLPVIASNVAGVITLTAKIAGASSGAAATGVIRVRAKIDAGVTTTVATQNSSDVDALGTGAATAGADGATTEVSLLTAALANIASSRYYYVCTSVHLATDLAVVHTHVSSKSEPIPGLRSVIIAANPDALSDVQTIAIGRNFERLQIVWQLNSEHTPSELVGNMAAIRQKWEQVDPAYNFDSYADRGDWLIKGCYRDADRPSGDDLNDAITDGITPIATNAAGSFVVMSVSTRSKDSTGSTDDFRAAETHRVSVADDFTDTWLLRHVLNYSNKKLASDKTLADGSVDPNQKYYQGVITPSVYKAFPRGLLREYEARGLLQEVDSSVASLRVVRDPNNGGRLECGVQLHVVDLLHQMTVRVAEVSTG